MLRIIANALKQSFVRIINDRHVKVVPELPLHLLLHHCYRFVTLTTFGGLTPIILERSMQAAQLIPMAIALGFGIVFASAIILVMVPCFYMLIEDVKNQFATQPEANLAGE